uniref:F-box domain-containing protein n=1 Tax=Araucaria cunninghamii TaxID=56994 RepID=A0A0D6QX59_ARACU
MGAVCSIARNQSLGNPSSTQVECSKRQRVSTFDIDERPRIFSCLPDEVSMQILGRVPRGCYSNLRMVSKTWNYVLRDSEIFKLRKELGLTEEWLYILLKDEEEKLQWHALDPLSGRWNSLPPMPDIVHEEECSQAVSGWSLWNAMGNTTIRLLSSIVKGWFGRKDSLDRTPFCGCAVGSLDGCLYVLGGFSKACAMRCVWRYDPQINVWTEVASMTTARAYCKTASLNNRLYAVGGVNRGRGGLAPLKSAEAYDPVTNTWTQISSMPFARSHIPPTAFLADMLKPIATGMTTLGGKLYVPQSLYSWPFFVDVGGEVYDPAVDSWTDMPNGMGEGWPARQAGTKLSVVVNGNLYALDPSSSLGSGKIKIYDPLEDAWKVVLRKVPVLGFTDSESPYLLAGFLGKLHVITKDNRDDIAVLQADTSKPASTSSSLSSSSSSSADSSDSEGDCWKSIASKSFGYVELVSCQVLDI